MDNITHTLAGGLLAEMGLRRRSRFAFAACLLGANAPDIDVFAPLFFPVEGISFHRGPVHAVFASFTEKDAAKQKQLWLKAGEKMLFADGTQGLALDTERLALKIVPGDDPAVITHDPTNRQLAAMLILMDPATFPMALGVIYEDPRATFESAVTEQNKAAASGKTPDLQKLVAKGQTWMVEKEPHQI